MKNNPPRDSETLMASRDTKMRTRLPNLNKQWADQPPRDQMVPLLHVIVSAWNEGAVVCTRGRARVCLMCLVCCVLWVRARAVRVCLEHARVERSSSSSCVWLCAGDSVGVWWCVGVGGLGRP